jgi:hypothetical protein
MKVIFLWSKKNAILPAKKAIGTRNRNSGRRDQYLRTPATDSGTDLLYNSNS